MKKFISIILFLVSFIFFGSRLVNAVVPASSPSATTTGTTIAQPAMEWHCLQDTRIAGHVVDLTTKPGDLPRADKPTYIFVCITTELGNVCTTGDSALDQQTIGYDGVTLLKQSKATGGNYEQQGFTYNGQPVPKDKIVANDQGKLTAPLGASITNQLVEPIRWQDWTPSGIGRKWVALNFVDPIIATTGTGGQQQGTFTFEGAIANCTSISWDPYGIIFDSQSLEPIPGIQVSLMKLRDNGTYSLVGGTDAASILNPLYTQEDGAFTFYVPDGTYRLSPVAADFTFPNVAAKLNQNYAKVYSDIYRGEDIIQKGAIQHRDIPLDSKTVPYTSQVKVISYFPMLDKSADTLIIQGRVSHPLTTINVYGKKPSATDKNTFVRTKLLGSFTANKQGQFEIKIDMTKLDPTEMVGDIELIKPDSGSALGYSLHSRQ